jgi:DNA-binding GntR family transcriptional regulator
MDDTRRIEQRSIAQQVHDHTKHMILAGELHGGQRIAEEHIAERFGISRTPVREALKQLESYGLVRYKNRSYVEVVSLDGENEARKIARVRAEVEGLAVRLLAEKGVTDEDCRVLWNLVEETERAASGSDLGEAFEADSRLHLEFARRANNRYLYDILERLDAKVQLCRIARCLTVEKVARDIDAHRLIVEAVCDGDSDRASELMKAHAVAFSQGDTDEAIGSDR